jgi:hypothetical protein
MPDIPCSWAPIDDELYRRYHDEEWGVPLRNSRALWEKFSLDGFQAGLSWIIVLRKRSAMRKEFDGFDPDGAFRKDFEGHEEARVQVLRSDNRVRVHASRGARERSRGPVPEVSGSAAHALSVRARRRQNGAQCK